MFGVKYFKGFFNRMKNITPADLFVYMGVGALLSVSSIIATTFNRIDATSNILLKTIHSNYDVLSSRVDRLMVIAIKDNVAVGQMHRRQDRQLERIRDAENFLSKKFGYQIRANFQLPGSLDRSEISISNEEKERLDKLNTNN